MGACYWKQGAARVVLPKICRTRERFGGRMVYLKTIGMLEPTGNHKLRSQFPPWPEKLDIIFTNPVRDEKNDQGWNVRDSITGACSSSHQPQAEHGVAGLEFRGSRNRRDIIS